MYFLLNKSCFMNIYALRYLTDRRSGAWNTPSVWTFLKLTIQFALEKLWRTIGSSFQQRMGVSFPRRERNDDTLHGTSSLETSQKPALRVTIITCGHLDIGVSSIQTVFNPNLITTTE